MEVNVGKPVLLPPEVAAAASGILTEAVTNVLRHADANNLLIDVHLTDSLTLLVRDDGVGVPAARLAAGDGIRGMRERAEMVGGTLDLNSSDPGTLVRAVLPVEVSPR